MKLPRFKKATGNDMFDAGNRAAELLRSIAPPDVEMDAGARERVMSRALAAMQRADSRPQRRSSPRTALVPALALIIVAMVVSAVLLPVFMTREKNAPVAMAASIQGPSGKVQVRSPGTGWSPASAGEKVRASSIIRTGRESSVSVRFPDGSLMRVSDGSEARISAFDAHSVAVQHISGGTYHRVRSGTRYVVSSHDISSRAVATAFNIDSRQPGRIEILCVEHGVQVAISRHEPIEVAEGQVMTVSLLQEKRAEKAPVSRERLLDERLCANVRSDAEAGFSTGIYRALDVPLDASAGRHAGAETPIELNGSASDGVVSLDWKVRAELDHSSIVLLRSGLSEPVYPDNEIARYTDVSINSSSDDSVTQGKTYQYRVAALSGAGEVKGYSNTVVIPVTSESDRPEPVSISLKGGARAGVPTLDWSVSGAARFSGFVVERTVQKAPVGSQTPQGSSSTRRIDSSSVFFTYTDDSALPGHSYSYRVGLVVNGAVMVYSEPVTVETAGR